MVRNQSLKVNQNGKRGVCS